MNSHGFRQEKEDLVLFLTVQPKSHQDELIGVQNGRCKIRITAPPVDGKANKHLVKYLAKLFRVSKSRVVIEKGATSKYKQIRLLRTKAAALPVQFTE